MNSFLDIGTCNALAALVLALPAALVSRLTRRPALAHALWLLVLLKLVTPPLFYWPIPWPGGSLGVSPVAARVEPFGEPPAEVLLPAEELPPPLEIPEDGPGPEPAQEPEKAAIGGAEKAPAPPDALVSADPDPRPEREESSSSSPEDTSSVPILKWQGLAAGVWLIGSAGWFLLAVRRVRRFQAGLRHSTRAPEDLQERARELAGRLGLSSPPEVRLVPGRVAPLLWWTGGPAWLVVPAALPGKISGTALDTLLLHELAHYRRRDHWVRALEFAALGLYWWHPIAWFACRELREAEELCCDAWVVTALPRSARAYATALVDTLDFLAGADPMPLTASGIGPVADLKRRLTMILRGVPPRALSWPAALVVLALACVLLPWLPVWGQEAAPGSAYRLTPPAAVEAPASKSELDVLRAELDRKLAEAELAKAKLKAAETDQARRLAAIKAGLLPVDGNPQHNWRFLATSGKPPEGVTIQIHISGLTGKADELKKILDALEKDLPGKEKRVLLLQTGPPGGMAPVPTPMYRPETAPAPPVIRSSVTPPIPVHEARPAQLEKKLDRLLQELEAIRRELKGGH